jgi:uncharacterized membrane protein YvbJ
MALIHCPECNKEISDKVKTCPYCGYPFEDTNKSANTIQQVEIASVNLTPKNPTKKINIIIISAIIVVLIAIIFGTISILQKKL